MLVFMICYVEYSEEKTQNNPKTVSYSNRLILGWTDQYISGESVVVVYKNHETRDILAKNYIGFV